MRRVKGATKFTIIQVIIDKLVHPRYFLSTIFPLPLLWIIQSFVSNPNPRAKFTFCQEKKKKTEKIVGKSKERERKEWIDPNRDSPVDQGKESTFKRVYQTGKKNGGGSSNELSRENISKVDD